jgi:hypothetical protein
MQVMNQHKNIYTGWGALSRRRLHDYAHQDPYLHDAERHVSDVRYGGKNHASNHGFAQIRRYFFNVWSDLHIEFQSNHVCWSVRNHYHKVFVLSTLKVWACRSIVSRALYCKFLCSPAKTVFEHTFGHTLCLVIHFDF